MMPAPALLPVIALLLPAASFLLLAIVAPLRRTGRPAGIVSLLFALASLAATATSFHLVHQSGEPIRLVVAWLPEAQGALASVGVLADAESLTMLLLVALVASLVQAYSLGYLHDEPPASLGRYYAYQSLFAFSMMGLVLAPNLLQLFVCWELVGLCSYLLIGFWYRKPEAAHAAVKAFWTTKAGDVGLLIGIVLLWRLTGTFDLGGLQRMAAAGLIPTAGLGVITFCLYLGAAGKSAQVPFHIWLPDAMEGPTPVSALIHAATMVTAGVYLLFRTSWLFALTPDVLLIVAWIGAVTAFLAAIMACAQSDIKRVLAYSTVSQLGYMMTAIGAGFAGAGFLHLLTHGVFKALLFLGAGAVIHAVGSNDLADMGGLAKRMPRTTIVFVVGALSLSGVPLFAGFASKEEILGAVWAGGLPVPFAMLLAAAGLTAFYMFRVVFLAFYGPPDIRPVQAAHAGGHAAGHPGAHDASAHAPHDPPVSMAVPLWVLAILSVVAGVALMVPAARPHFAFESPAWLTPAAVGVALAGILLAWLTYQRRVIDAEALARLTGPLRHAAHAKFWFDDAIVAIYRYGLLAGARVIGWTDRYLVDGVLNVVSAWTVSAAGILRRVQTGRVQDYVFSVAVGVLALIVWMEWVR
jgi:NADH-quinone oxidoreductase subunit L